MVEHFVRQGQNDHNIRVFDRSFLNVLITFIHLPFNMTLNICKFAYSGFASLVGSD